MFKQNYYAQKSASHNFYSEKEVASIDFMSTYYKNDGNNHQDYYKTVGINKETDCYNGCKLELDFNNMAVSM